MASHQARISILLPFPEERHTPTPFCPPFTTHTRTHTHAQYFFRCTFYNFLFSILVQTCHYGQINLLAQSVPIPSRKTHILTTF